MIDPTEIKGLKDYRDRLRMHTTKRFPTRPIENITHIAVHHSLTKTGSAEAFARYHVGTNNWPGIGYHIVIEQDGVIKWCNEFEKRTYHVGNSNGFSVGVCMTGDFRTDEPKPEQWQSLLRVLNWLKTELNISIENIQGHNEFSGYSWKECPCVDMTELRAVINKPKIKQKKIINYAPGSYSFKDILRNEVNFYLGELKRLNPQITELQSPKKTKVEVKPPSSSPYLDTKTSTEIREVIKEMEHHNYKVFLNDKKDYNLNIVGVRSHSQIPNSFNDKLMVFWKFKGSWTLKQYKITTDPVLYWLQNPMNVNGTAILKEGQYKNAYRIGKHTSKSGSYTALVQAEPVTVIRDYDKDADLDFTGSREETGLFGINIHLSKKSGKSSFVDKWSAGCQVFKNSNEYKEFISVCQIAASEWGNSFTYSLINNY